MLYKVTPAMEAPRKKAAEAGEGGRKRRKTSVYDADGNEVLISLMCLKCRTVKPLAQFGLRRMSDGAVRNQPWCRGCRGALTKKAPVAEVAAPGSSPVDGKGATTPPPVLTVLTAPLAGVHEGAPAVDPSEDALSVAPAAAF